MRTFNEARLCHILRSYLSGESIIDDANLSSAKKRKRKNTKKIMCILLLYPYLCFVLMLNWHSFPVNGFDNLLSLSSCRSFLSSRIYIGNFTPFFCAFADKSRQMEDRREIKIRSGGRQTANSFFFSMQTITSPVSLSFAQLHEREKNPVFFFHSELEKFLWAGYGVALESTWEYIEQHLPKKSTFFWKWIDAVLMFTRHLRSTASTHRFAYYVMNARADSIN